MVALILGNPPIGAAGNCSLEMQVAQGRESTDVGAPMWVQAINLPGPPKYVE